MAWLISAPALRTVWASAGTNPQALALGVKPSRGSLDARMGADVGHVALHVSDAVGIAEGAIELKRDASGR